MAESYVNPEWIPPNVQIQRGQLKLYNSFSRKNEIFQPMRGKLVTWYNCGPTVYDHSHMGHARSYMTFDIIRRILNDYFGYEVFFVQNVTDIDDKIIKRARQSYLYQNYVQKVTSKELTRDQIISNINEGLQMAKNKLKDETDEGKQKMMSELISKVEKLNLTSNSEDHNLDQDKDLLNYVQDSKDVLSDYLDLKFGKTINDNSIFESLPKEMETSYNHDMRSLNILPPNVVTRVSEYVPEIVTYIEKIIANGYAYESAGSVYFDSQKFNQDHKYALLLPEAIGNVKAMAEGEGDLFLTSSSNSQSCKKSAADFVLWKSSKPGEPTWPSPWGDGRPGWHIECSVMANSILGSNMDIHSGGIDLRFPHHENEICQSRAYHSCQSSETSNCGSGSNWVNYFLHSGHLNIEGLKMSKSLKNFVTIQEALKKNTQRQLRFAFLLHPWTQTLNYSDKVILEAITFEKSILELFLNVKDLIRTHPSEAELFVKWQSKELELNNVLQETIQRVEDGLCDNIDTKAALNAIRDHLVPACNAYLMKPNMNLRLLVDICGYIRKLLSIFGAIDDSMSEFTIDIMSSSSSSTKNSSSSNEQVLMPYLDVLASFREKVRNVSMTSKDAEVKGQLLDLCDDLRDEILPELGIRLEDRDGRTRLKIVDRDTLLKEREIKKSAENLKKMEKLRKQTELELKNQKLKMTPQEWLENEFPAHLFSKFDSKGLPTHAADGTELSKGQMKKNLKNYETHVKKHEELQKK